MMLNLLLITWALFAGLLMTRITNYFKLPDVTAYLIVGVIIGPSILGKIGINGIGFTSFEEVETLSILSDVALGFIAFIIGNQFKASELKTIGKRAVIIGIFEATTATLFVDIALIITHLIVPHILSFPMAITLGAIAAATAPAATFMVINQYKAKGPVTNTLLPVVALDDAIGLIIFAISFGVAESIINGDTKVISLIVEPILQIVSSLMLGTLVAMILTELEKHFHSNSNRLILIIGSIILTVAISKMKFEIFSFNVVFSPLLVCMMLGTIFCNTCPLASELMSAANSWAQPILVLFFVLSGAELNLDVFKSPVVILIGFIYMIARCIGKYTGARFSATITHCEKTVRDFLGITLIPQAGVALGMSSIVAKTLQENGMLVRNIVLFGVLVYELIGPTLTKISLIKAGEITEKPKDVIDRRKNKLINANKKN